jgi:DNA-binding PadR family transcriptional regulator
MFDFKHHPHDAHGTHALGDRVGRRRHNNSRESWVADMGRHLRGDLRRNMRQRGPGGREYDLGEMFGIGGRGGRPGVRRGEVRTLILGALADRPMHGYEVIQALEQKSRGIWRPSAGSIYPTLQQLADEGLITGEDVDGRRTYTLTDAGRKAVADSPAGPTWDKPTADGPSGVDVTKELAQLAAAVLQVHRMGSAHANREVTKIITNSRKQVYRILAEDSDAGDSTEEASDTTA